MGTPSLKQRFYDIISKHYNSCIYDVATLDEWPVADLAELETIINAELQRRADENSNGTLQSRIDP